ncbi:hypothetical protein THAOC_23937, partial [Thalassiosira oceanica]
MKTPCLSLGRTVSVSGQSTFSSRKFAGQAGDRDGKRRNLEEPQLYDRVTMVNLRSTENLLAEPKLGWYK